MRKVSKKDEFRWHMVKPGKTLCGTKRQSIYAGARISKTGPCRTITARSRYFHFNECRELSLLEYFRLSSFPDDYKTKNDRLGKYLIGMSVPPLMAKAVARAVCEQWLGVNYG